MREQLKNSFQIWSNECGHSYTENDEINGIARATHVSRCDPKNVNTRTQKMMFSYQHVLSLLSFCYHGFKVACVTSTTNDTLRFVPLPPTTS